VLDQAVELMSLVKVTGKATGKVILLVKSVGRAKPIPKVLVPKKVPVYRKAVNTAKEQAAGQASDQEVEQVV
jgi:hypothetical protein